MSKLIRFFNQHNSMFKKMHFVISKWYYIKTNIWYRIFLKGCGSRNTIVKPLSITPESIVLFNDVYIWYNSRIEGVELYANIKFTPTIIFHDNVSIQQNLHLTCASKVEIFENTAVAANVTITDIHHSYDDIRFPIERQAIKTNPVVIGKDCKIYNNAVILPGTIIGNHCSIGANSVVSGIFPDFSIIVGAPAKIIKRYSFEKETWLRTDTNGNFI